MMKFRASDFLIHNGNYNDKQMGVGPMSLREHETRNSTQQLPQSDSRRRHESGDMLILSELNPKAVVDDLDGDNVPLNLVTFGSVREICPKCRQTHLKLVLRQATVRIAHLFCADCESCFDAHYPNGQPALSI